jgi:hypothetical protein
MLIYSTSPIFSARFEVPDEDNYDGPYQVGWWWRCCCCCCCITLK